MAQTPKKAKIEAAPTLRDRAANLRARVPEQAPDPVLAVIREGRALMPAYQKARRLPEGLIEPGCYGRPKAEEDASNALFDHFRDRLLQTAPTTPVGGIALAKYAIEFSRTVGLRLDEDGPEILALIAKVRLA